MVHYCLPLNKPVLVFFPPQHDKMLRTGRLSESLVVQVKVTQNLDSVFTVNDAVAYVHAQQDITVAIERLLMAHIISPLPARVELQGNGYSLHGERKQWDYGKTLKLSWGGQPVRSFEDKWLFVFAVD